jgi:NADPH2:quinone reductase
MKAIRLHEFGGPEAMALETVPDPVPAAGQVLVRIRAAGVNPVDTYLRAGLYRPDLPLPWTPGLDGAGTVEAVGQEVTRLKPGQRVYMTAAASGTYAELALGAEAKVFPLPDSISCAQGAALGVPYGTAYRALFQKAQALPGETVLVHGASGGVGLAALQWARAAGLRVIGTAGSPEGLDLVRREGAHHVLNHRQPDYQKALLELAPKGVDVILEMLANVNLGHDLALLAKGGRVVVIGSRGPVEINPRDAMARDAAIFGMSLFNAPARDVATIHAALRAGLEQGTLKPVVSRELPLSDAPAAHHAVVESSTFGKIVLIP